MEKIRVAIVGGGITGLATAYYLQKVGREKNLPIEFFLVESLTSLGGKIGTEFQDGFLIERSADSFASFKPWGFEFCTELGISLDSAFPEGKIIEPSAKGFFMLIGGQLHQVPLELLGFGSARWQSLWNASFLTFSGKLRASLEWLVPSKNGADDESVASFLRRRFGVQLATCLLEPLMASIHAGKSERLSLSATYPLYQELERKYGSLSRAFLRRKKIGSDNNSPLNKISSQAPFVSIQAGMGFLIERLIQEVKDQVKVLTSHSVTGIDVQDNGQYQINFANQKSLTTDITIITAPAYVTATILQQLSAETSQTLRQIPYASTAVISLVYRREDVLHPLNGSGFLVANPDSLLTGCTWSSSKWSNRAPKGFVQLRCFLGSADTASEVESKSEEQLAQEAHQSLKPILGISSSPLFYRTFKWIKAMPQYELGHMERISQIEKSLTECPGILLAGSAYRGIGIPDCVKQAKEAAEKTIQLVQYRKLPNLTTY